MTLPESRDFSYLFSQETNSRKPSPLKTCIHHFFNPNLIFLGGGLPMSDYFPWDNLSADSPMPPFTKGIGAPPTGSSDDTVNVTVKKNEKTDGDIPLARSLQYGHTAGQPELVDFLRGHNNEIHNMKYSDWDLIASIGNTNSWESTLRVFCNRGDVILAEEYSFSSSLAAAEAQGVTTIPVPIDAFGIVPEKLEELLDNWTPNAPKPKLLYTIPTGQNPTGTSLPGDRKDAIYRVAQKHDFLIVEDEPYYFLQVGDYIEDLKKREEVYSAPRPTHEQFKQSLVKSFLSCDTEGRVIRLDSFSKILGPGTRVGWITGSKKLLKAYVSLHEMTIQSPSGFSQSVICGTLQRWGQAGYLDWLIGLRHEYVGKRDHTIDALRKYLPNNDVFNVVPPVAGMFFTIDVDASAHPEFKTKYNSDPAQVEHAIYEKVITRGVLVVPGGWFKTLGQTNPPLPDKSDKSKANEIFFRGTYAAVAPEKLEEGLRRLCNTLKEEFGFTD